MFVRVLDTPLCVRMCSPMLEDLEVDDRLLDRLNELNAEIREFGGRRAFEEAPKEPEVQ